MIKTNDNSYGSTYTINDQMGRKVMTGKLNQEETPIDINQLAKAVYFIEIGRYPKQAVKMIKK